MSARAPWSIVHVDLAEGVPDLSATPGVHGTLLVVRFEGAVLGEIPLLPENLPLRGSELAFLAASRIRGTVAELLRLGPDDLPAPNPCSPPLTDLPPPFGPDVLARLSRHLAARRARPVSVTGSIVICTRNRPRDIGDCLASLQGEIAAGREVVVVDNGPDAATEAAVRAHPGVRYVVEPRPGLSHARNTGVAAATSDVVVFLDDDVRPEPGWIEPLLKRFAEPEVAVVCGLVLPEALETDAQIRFQYELGFGGMGLLPLRFDAEFVAGWRRGVPVWSIGAGANMALRRRTLMGIGGFDGSLGAGSPAPCSEDSELWHRTLFAGWTAIYEPLSVVRHRHRREIEALERQAYNYSLGHAVALFVQHARDGDRGNLVRAFRDIPLSLARRVLRVPANRLRGKRDTLLGPWLKGYLAALRHAGIAFREPPPLLTAKDWEERRTAVLQQSPSAEALAPLTQGRLSVNAE